MNDAILGASLEAIWFSTVFATKMVLIQMEKCTLLANETKKANILKVISQWHEVILMPVTKMVTDRHQIPCIEIAFLSDKDNHFVKSGDMISQHICLYSKISKYILDKVQSGLGSKTLEEVTNWFRLMDMTSTSKLCENASEQVTDSLKKIIEAFEDMDIQEVTMNATSQTEYEFFDSPMLFIRVGHLINMYSICNAPNKLPHSSQACMRVSLTQYKNWEELSGMLFCDVFNLPLHGIWLSDGKSRIPDSPFALMELPYPPLIGDFATGDDELPSIMDLHEDVIQSTLKGIQDRITTQESLVYRKELKQVEYIFKKCRILREEHTPQLNRRNRQMRYYQRHRDTDKPYCPQDPDRLQRDTFVMGEYSHKKPVSNRGKRKFKIDRMPSLVFFNENLFDGAENQRVEEETMEAMI